jgi:hypothetical protein
MNESIEYNNDASSLFRQCIDKFPDYYGTPLPDHLNKIDITYMNQCSSSFSSQSALPFCSCNGFGGGGIDGLMVFSLLMTVISTASKIWKLKNNIQKRHQNIEEAYKNKASRGESGGISSVELNELGDSGLHANPAVEALPPDTRMEEMESLLANVQKQVMAAQKENASKFTDMEEAQKASADRFANMEARLNNLEASN